MSREWGYIFGWFKKVYIKKKNIILYFINYLVNKYMKVLSNKKKSHYQNNFKVQ